MSLGGELFRYLDEVHTLTERDAIFYAPSVLLVLEYLHERQIAYRDLKPENVLLDATGFVKVCDFGFAKKILERSYTLCGTPEYLGTRVPKYIRLVCIVSYMSVESGEWRGRDIRDYTLT